MIIKKHKFVIITPKSDKFYCISEFLFLPFVVERNWAVQEYLRKRTLSCASTPSSYKSV